MPMTEYMRPWKLVTLVLVVNALVYGSMAEDHAPTSVIVARVVTMLVTYMTAPWGVRVVIARRWRWLPLALFYAWLCIVSAAVVWMVPRAGIVEFEDFARDFNLWPSVRWYLFCGFLWLYRASMADFKRELSALAHRVAK